MSYFGKVVNTSTHPTVVFQGDACFICIRCFYEDKLVFPDFVQNPHVIPCGHDGLHVEIAWEERYDPVWDNFAVLDQDAPEVAHHRGVVADLEPRADRDLVAAARDDLRGASAWARARTRRGRTSGRKELRVSVIWYDSCTTGVNCSILGYMSRGESVPEVMTTLLKRSNTGPMASEASRQVRWKTGLGTVALSVSKGSRMRMKPRGIGSVDGRRVVGRGGVVDCGGIRHAGG